MQWDSSAYFTNGTSPSNSTTIYLWDFGDGSVTSTDINPFHTFPAFDSNYVVCLTATNRCGSYTYCDTVWIDSLHIGGNFKVSTNRLPERSEGTQDASYLSMTNASNSTNQPTTNNQQLSTNQLSKSIRPINHNRL
jgi:PKD repeat protein